MAADYAIREALPEDAEALSLFLRLSDYLEIWRAEGSRPDVSLGAALDHSARAWTVTDGEGEILFMAGVCPVGPSLAVPWLMGTAAVDQHPVAFTRAAKKLLREMLSFGTLVNYADALNDRSIRWLSKLGFTVSGETAGLGPGASPFHPFFMRNAECALC